MSLWRNCFCAAACLALLLETTCGKSAEPQAVTAPPDSFFALVRERDREVARAFYKKHLDIGGMPVVAAAEVADEALRRTHEIVTHMLAGRPDIVQAMAGSGMYLIII